MRVFVYYNLHKKLWSVKALDGSNKGRVIAHSDYVELSNAKPKVSQAGRQRVLRDKCKNVHAGITGTLENLDRLNMQDYKDSKAITYNPYFYETFVYVDTKQAYTGSDNAILIDKKVYVK